MFAVSHRSFLVLMTAMLVSLSGCAHLTIQRMPQAHLSLQDRLYVWFEFDRIPLAPRFQAALREQGIQLAASKADASVLLTGAYVADYDVTHWRFRWSHFKLVRQDTGETLMLLETGAGGLGGVDGVIERMVQAIHTLY